MIADALRVGFAGLIGACLGSFVSTAVVRQLRGEQVLAGRSHCDGCEQPLAAWSTVPVLSYVFSRGRCRRCKAPIDPLHSAGEVLGALIGGAAWCGPVSGGADVIVRAILTSLGLCLLGLGLYDAKTLRIPDPLSLGVLVCAILLAALQGEKALLPALIWGVATFFALDVVRRLYRRTRGQDGLGFGDVKLLAALAVWLGAATPWALLSACVVALLWIGLRGRPSERLPFGPFLALGGFAVGIGRQALGAAA